MKTIAEFDYNGYIITVEGIFNEFELGCRDLYGAPLEPDFDAYFEIETISIGEKVFDDSKYLAKFLGTNEIQINELINEALNEAYEAELDYYYESQIGMQYYD